MKLHDLSAVPESTQTARRIGRGHGSGWGKTSGKGHKGQKAKAGCGFHADFEGGQTPLQRRFPKRGFVNIFAKDIVAINVGTSESSENGAVADIQALPDAGIVGNSFDGVKILSNGKLTKSLTVKATSFSEAAEQKIEAAGGKAKVTRVVLYNEECLGNSRPA